MNRSTFIASTFLAVAALFAAPAFAQEADDLRESWHHQPAVSAPLLNEAPTIDGRVTDREWINAAKLAPLIQWSDGRMDPEETAVFIGHTEEAIYMGWRVHRDWDGPMNIRHTEPGRHDGRSVWLDDCIEIYFDLENQGQRAVNLAANAAGGFGDGMGRSGSGTEFAASWDWDYAARETDFGWEGEVSITFKELGFDGPPDADQTWGFNFWRNNKTPEGSVSSFAYKPAWGGALRFDDSAPAFRIRQAGPVGDTSIGMLADLINFTGTAQPVDVELGIYRRNDEAGDLDFIDQVMSGLEQAGQDVAAFTTAEDQIAQLLDSFYQTIEQRTERVTVEPGHRMPLNLTATNTPAGDYVIAYRASTESEGVIAAGLIPARQWEPVELTTVPYFLRAEQVDVALSLHTQQLREQVQRVRVRLEQDGQALAERTVAVDEVLAGIGLPTEEIVPGPYHVAIEGLSGDGEVVTELRKSRYRPEPPFWVTQQHGKQAFVPEPWTPVEAASNSASIWGRTYQFDGSFLPTQMISQDEPLFAAAPRLTLRVEGQDISLDGALELAETTDEYADYRWTGAAGAVSAKARVRVEFDGFTTVDLELDTEGVTVEQLFVEFPLVRKHAKLYTLNAFYNEQRGSNIEPYSHGMDRSGRIGDGFAIGFNHAVWIGTPERGFQWVAETAEHWHNADRGRAIEIVPDNASDQMMLRLRVIDQPTETDHLSYRWGLSASPARPGPRTAGKELYYLQMNYPGGWEEGEGSSRLEGMIDAAHNLGANWLAIFSQWNRDFAFGQPIREGEGVDVRRRLVEHIHEADLKTAWYTGWNGLDPNMQMYPFYGEAMRRVPTRFSIGGYKECCYGGYDDYLANGSVWMVENLGVDGIYLDSTPSPEPCLNPYHGCGFVDPETGHRIVTRDIWARRELFKRLYKIFHGEVVDNGIIYGHDGRPPLMAITPFVDINHTGEGAKMKDYENLDFYLAQYSPTQYGIPVEHAWRASHPVPRNFAWGSALIHGNRIKMYPGFALHDWLQENSYEPERGIDWRMWVPNQWFEWENYQWYPYYSNQDVLTVSGDGIYASFHHNARGQMIFNVLNITPEAQEVQFEFNADALDLPQVLHVRDAVTHEAFKIENGRFSLEVLGQRPRVLMIDVTEVPMIGPGTEQQALPDGPSVRE